MTGCAVASPPEPPPFIVCLLVPCSARYSVPGPGYQLSNHPAQPCRVAVGLLYYWVTCLVPCPGAWGAGASCPEGWEVLQNMVASLQTPSVGEACEFDPGGACGGTLGSCRLPFTALSAELEVLLLSAHILRWGFHVAHLILLVLEGWDPHSSPAQCVHGAGAPAIFGILELPCSRRLLGAL